ncbi:hypothetical protein ABZ348_15745 [Streptomyces sp. NPDC005963]|uniref:hypothetical protein n=1 Tax=Streptomyces sp. NPDC005963 TaxID=3156721 RepID=UPI0033FD9A65
MADELDHLRARVAALESSADRPPPGHHRVRSFFSALLIVIGCVLAPLGAVAAWSADEVGNTDRYVDTVAPLASDADVQNAVATRVTDAVMEHIDLNSVLEGVAPADRPRLTKALGKLGDSLESALRSFVHDKSQEVVASDAFKTVWVDANRKVHDAVDKALTGNGGGAVKLTNDAVKIDLGPVVDQVKQRLVDDGLTAAERIPEVNAEFTVFKSEDIGKVKTGFRLLQIAGFWLPVLALLLVVVGVLLAVRRRRALVAAALGVAFALLLLGAALTGFRAVYLDALPSDVSQSAAGSVYDALVRYLRTTVRTVVALGIVVALAAWLTGPGRWAALVQQMWHTGLGAVRATAARAGLHTGPVGPWVRRYRRWVVWVLVAGAVLAYVFWSYPTAWVVVGLALALLFALALVELVAGEPAPERRGAGRSTPPPSPERPNTDGGGSGTG